MQQRSDGSPGGQSRRRDCRRTRGCRVSPGASAGAKFGEADGPAEGAGAGAAAGMAVGATDGAAVGARAGTAAGACESAAVGTSAGADAGADFRIAGSRRVRSCRRTCGDRRRRRCGDTSWHCCGRHCPSRGWRAVGATVGIAIDASAGAPVGAAVTPGNCVGANGGEAVGTAAGARVVLKPRRWSTRQRRWWSQGGPCSGASRGTAVETTGNRRGRSRRRFTGSRRGRSRRRTCGARRRRRCGGSSGQWRVPRPDSRMAQVGAAVGTDASAPGGTRPSSLPGERPRGARPALQWPKRPEWLWWPGWP